MMRILLLAHSFNSLTQRLHVELRRAGHKIGVELDINDDNSREAVKLFHPDLIIAPFLKRLIPEDIWRQHTCFIVHPGPPGDRGPASLDWAILNHEPRWGITVLEATGELDAGPVWASRSFEMRNAPKSSLYRFEVTDAAAACILEAVDRFETDGFKGRRKQDLVKTTSGTWRGLARQKDRRIDWQHDDTETILRKIRSADGTPGVQDRLAGLDCRLFDAHRESFLTGRPGQVIARRQDAVCRATWDGAVWISHIRLDGEDAFKLPATMALGDHINHLPTIGMPFHAAPQRATWQDIRYRERGEVGFLFFDFYNGAMGTRQCKRLLAAFNYAQSRRTKVIVLAGGTDFWSNGLDLNLIEAADSPADESWRNINAMDDLCEAIITTTSHLTIAALRGNAGAGGCFLARAADTVMARSGIVLNPHYRNMGNLYGSEYWTYLLPSLADTNGEEGLLVKRLPLGAEEALNHGLVDYVASADPLAFDQDVQLRATQLANEKSFRRLVLEKQLRRHQDESIKPLNAYRREELDHMRLNFYGFDPAYHVARYRFVHRTPLAWTPLYLAPHRRRTWHVAEDAREIA